MTLTARQQRALDLFAEGLTTEQIADRLGCGPRTVKRELDKARAALDAPTTAVAYIRSHHIRRPRRRPAPQGESLWGKP